MYQKLSKYYHHIFPANPVASNFIKERAVPGLPVLDIACALGDLARYMKDEGFDVFGIDLSDEMIEIAKERHSDISFELLDMAMIDQLNQKFGTIYCLGNSLVHLENSYQIEKFVELCHQCLTNNGKLIFQIINYDRIIAEKVTSLPTIENKTLKFVRDYIHSDDGEHVEFKTTLEVEGKSYTNSVFLLMLKKADLESALRSAGFSKLDFFGGFDESPWTSSSYATVVCASK